MKFTVLNRKTHYWLSAFVALPAVVIIASGLLLQVKKQLDWVQPPEQRGEGVVPTIPFATILEISRGVPQAAVRTWDDIHRLDVRPSRGMIKVTTKTNWEIQIDAASGAVLQVAYRRSDLIESIHDGSFFHEGMKYALFLPAGVCLFLLWITGLYLFIRPLWVNSRRGRRV